MPNTDGYEENLCFRQFGEQRDKDFSRFDKTYRNNEKAGGNMEEIKKITLEITPEDYNQIERKSIYNNCNIDDYIINKTLDRNLRADEEEKRTERIYARVTPTELKYIQDKIRGTNFTMSEFIRASVLDKEILVIEGVEELAKQLRAVGKNLNQLVMLSHKGLIKTPNIVEVEKKLDEIWNIMNILITKKKR